ncbi:hypothetical protein F1643_13350 [Azospirillum sp. INR13]|uniref:helix-turn-helix domain-containing protein n=1 Tax=Azospirillum sp. INR13 TaxID=2596919 RepID=UPI0018922702|nr:helix-turn-helix domain-containing protein [Azospirillum sp. INR13]MBF5095303.1 hypothetical protein [Azospirillum sp. INR13]
MNPETLEEGFHKRLELLIGSEEPFAWAKRVGIPSSTFSRFWNENTIPKSEHLCRIADYERVSLDWLLRGQGPMRPDSDKEEPATFIGAAEAPAPSTDRRLIGRLVEKILLVYKEMGVAIAIHQATERAAKEHDRIVATVADPDDRLTEVGEVTAALRQELRAAASDPGSSKRRA